MSQLSPSDANSFSFTPSAHAEPRQSRPLSKNYGIATGSAGLLPWSWVVAHMVNARNYWIASTRPDGRPHVAPVWGLWHEGAFYFSSHRESRKARNLIAQPAIVVHLESGDETVIFEGIAAIVTDRSLLQKLNAEYASKYALSPAESIPVDPDGPAIAFVLRPDTVLGWLEKDFPNTATRWTF